MKYLKFTYVDALTERPITETPAANGPKFPSITGLEFAWARESRYPTPIPEFFGTCPDGSATDIPGVLAVIDQADWEVMRQDEMRARIPASVTPRQARLALLGAGLLDQVTTAINGMEEPTKTVATINWEYATAIVRTDEWVANLGGALGMTDEQLDELFRTAATL